jgi:hypothetical protein
MLYSGCARSVTARLHLRVEVSGTLRNFRLPEIDLPAFISGSKLQ